MMDFTAWVEKNKTLWTRVYDEVIAPDFEKAWQKKDENHKTGLEQKEENQQILFNHLNDEIQKTARLVKENQMLKARLRKQDETTAQSASHATSSTNEVMAVPNEELHALTEKYDELSKKYRDVSQKVKYLERKNQTVMQRNKDMKDSVRAWQEYADRQAEKQKHRTEYENEDGRPRLLAAHPLQEDRPYMPSSPGSVATIRTPTSLAELGRSSSAPIDLLPQSVLEGIDLPESPRLMTSSKDRRMSGSVTPKQHIQTENIEQQHVDNTFASVSAAAGGPAISNISRPSYPSLHTANPSSSQTTVDEVDEQTGGNEVAMHTESDDDVPQFVSERSLKRKRGQPCKSRFEIYADRSSDGTPAKPFRVKEEPRSSPPPTMFKLLRNETIDLDDPSPHVLKTPRHPKRQLSDHSNSTGTLHHQRSNSAPFTQCIKGEEDEVDYRLESSVPHDDSSEPPATSTEARAFSEPSSLAQIDQAVLRSLDPNALSTVSEEPPNKRARRAANLFGNKQSILAESGDTPPPMDEDRLRLPPHLARAQLSNRKPSLKNSPRLAKKAHQTPKSAPAKVKVEKELAAPANASSFTHTPSGGSRLRSVVSKSHPRPRDQLDPGDRQIWTMKAPEPRTGTRRVRESPAKQEGRLREKPIAELSVKDFKANPTYNQGYTYAFSETVRKRSDRLCLPGCTNPQCCGSTFRTFAEAQAPLPSSQEEALLEDYLGDVYSGMDLTQMSSEERQELVLQARTKKMAKESGKHREAYERRRTPPGFWRVDFPTTQEQQDDRERAKEQEKTIVQERWLEAHRKGGKWIFRDE